MTAPDLRLQSGPHVFVTDLGAPTLGEQDRHHLTKSLRLRSGDPLTISDGDGNWCTARFGEHIEATGPTEHVGAPDYELSLGIALTKAAKPELAVQKATEIGIDHVVVFEAQHSVARWDDAKREHNAQRLRVVAREASMQSRRVRIPTVRVVASLNSLVENGSTIASPVRADFTGVAIAGQHRFVLIGPEGGWSEQERSLLPAAVNLGPTVLRAETAAIVATTLMTGSRD